MKVTRKRLLSLMLCFVLVLSLMPMTASAAVAYNIWVGGVRIGNYNQNDVLGDGSVSYDPGTKTLTFKKAVEINNFYENALIYAVMDNASDTLTVVGPESDSPVTLTHWKPNGIYVKTGNLAVRGNFIIDCGGCGMIAAAGNVEIFGNSIIKIVTKAKGVAAINGKMTVSGDVSLTVNGDTSGIQAEYVTLSSSGDIKVESNVSGVYGERTVNISGSGDVNISAGECCIGSGCDNVNISGSGDVTITAGAGGYGIRAPYSINLSSSGNVEITSGAMGTMSRGVKISGSGDLIITTQSYGIYAYDISGVTFSGNGDVEVYGKDGGILLRGNDLKVLLNGISRSISLKSDSNEKAVYNVTTKESSVVAGTNFSKYNMTGNPASESVLYTLKSPVTINAVAIAGLDQPIVGEHPDTTFTVTNAQGYKLTGSAYWVKYVDGIGTPITDKDIFESGFQYGCYLSVSTDASRPFAYVLKPGSHGSKYNEFDGTLTVNGTNQNGTVNLLFTELSLVWWQKEPLNPDCGGDPANCPGTAFMDMPAYGNWAHNPIDWAVTKGITTGTSSTTFSPDKICTRGQIVTFLWRTAGCPEPQSTINPFKDVKEGDFFYKAVLWAVEKGVTTGTSKTTFSPDKDCTRDQIVTFLWRAKGAPNPSNTAHNFADIKSNEYYYTAVLWAVENGITTGTSGTKFSPAQSCTRAQAVTFLYRAFK